MSNPPYKACRASSSSGRRNLYGLGRLDSSGGWVPDGPPTGMWWQMDVGSVEQIAGVVTQGYNGLGAHNNQWCQTYVKSFTVQVSLDACWWTNVDDGKIFTGNNAVNREGIPDGSGINMNGNQKVQNLFAVPVKARYLLHLYLTHPPTHQPTPTCFFARYVRIAVQSTRPDCCNTDYGPGMRAAVLLCSAGELRNFVDATWLICTWLVTAVCLLFWSLPCAPHHQQARQSTRQ